MQAVYYYQSPLGEMLMTAEKNRLTGLWFADQKYAPDFPENAGNPGEKILPVFAETVRWLDKYFSGGNPDFLPEMEIAGTDFRKAVWHILAEIPYGETATYGRIAKQLEEETGKRVSARAVGQAVGRNRFTLLIPCHRVVGADGKLTGYAGGLSRKEALLKLEGIIR
ncbi:MAG: methylated-DNA--[Eubacterium sp.]|nr:methylated-DNA--[protein]-cysteine S-methyltransferase [Eubacterium sp.]